MNDDLLRYTRTNILFAAAYVTILLCLAVTVWFSQMSEYAQGVVTLVIGRFLGYTDAVYAFEFGTTRANKAKDTTISNLTAQPQEIAQNETSTTTVSNSTSKL